MVFQTIYIDHIMDAPGEKQLGEVQAIGIRPNLLEYSIRTVMERFKLMMLLSLEAHSM